ncbi:MAG: type III-A CRISPR-associated RAMP protein Csm5 [Thermoproteota archaeon]|uniref:type III-A CRISPR-associated RAMP protein Csm5 n=2 Tax=Thermoprotei TaxID=183924 RepID=UPI00316151FF
MSRESLFREVFTIVLEPVTPVHVWGGREAVIGIDALVRGDELTLINFEEILEKAPEDVLRRFTILLKSARPKEAIASFLKELESRELLSGLRVPIKTKPSIELNSRVKVLHEYIIPGSELKGYIRTGIIKGLLREIPNADKIIADGINLEKKAKNAGLGIEAKLLRFNRPKKQGGFVDALSIISVSDPLAYEQVEKSLRRLRVVHTSGLVDVASLLAITFSGGRLKYEVAIRKVGKPRLISKTYEKNVTEEVENILEKINNLANKIGNKNWLLEALRKFGCDLIKIELSKIKGNTKLRNYEDLLSKLEKDLCNENTTCVPARIGFMTGHESKTIIPEIKNYNPRIYDEVKRRMQQELHRVWDARTLKLVEVDKDLFGVGWCKICVE